MKLVTFKHAGALALTLALVGTGFGVLVAAQMSGPPEQAVRFADPPATAGAPGAPAIEPTAARGEEEKPTRLGRDGNPLPDGAVARIGTPKPQSETRVYCVTFAPGGKTLAVGALDKEIRLFDPATGNEVRQLRLETYPVAYGVAFSPDGKKLASAGFGGPAPSPMACGTATASVRPSGESAAAVRSPTPSLTSPATRRSSLPVPTSHT